MALFKYDGSAAAMTAAPQNEFAGSGGIDTINGTGGADLLKGGQGDLLIGGAGDDTYWVLAPNAIDRVSEQAGGGTDQIVAWQNINLANYANVENLLVSSPSTLLAGNQGDNIIQGGDGFQELYGGSAGQDILVGGATFDVFIVYKGQGNDVIQDFTPSEGDIVRLKAGFTSFSQVQANLSQVGADVKLDLGGGEGLLFRNLQVSQLSAQSFQLQLDHSKLGAQTFAEEFSSPLSLWDPANAPQGRWRPDMGFGGPDNPSNYNINNGLATYVSPYFRGHNGDFPVNPFTSNADGTLTITAQPSSNPDIFGHSFTSGMISSEPSFAQQYGYFEMRAQIPNVAGAWSAFWLTPDDGAWPPEADIMEGWGATPGAILNITHTGQSGTNTSEGMTQFQPDSADGYHTYGLLWTPQTLTWYIDDVATYQQATPADMNKPMYIIANLAVTNQSGTVAQQAMPLNIDYIHAYALPGMEPTPGQNLSGSSITGGAGNDTISSSGGDTLLFGGQGADLITGGAGPDVVNGNTGRDTIHGGAGDDWLYGGQGDDLIYADDGADWLFGNLGSDTIYAGNGDDIIRGGQANDLIFGGAGNDWISGDRGDDVVSGGAGADIFHTFGDNGTDVVTDFNRAEGDRVQLDPGTTYTVKQDGANVAIQMGGGGVMALNNVQLASLDPGWIFIA